jgi:hypothetical protein
MSRPPNLGLYCSDADLPLLYELLGDDLAFIAPDGERRWRATFDRPRQKHFRMELWHIEGGPLQVVSGDRKDPVAEVADPWAGWIEQRAPHLGPPLPATERRTTDWRDDPERPGIDTEGPLFCWTQNLFSIAVRTKGKEAGSTCGISNLAWVGNTQAMIGHPAPEVTLRRWNKLKRDIGTCAVKVPPGGPSGTGKPAFWAFPQALATGGPFDRYS